MSDVNDSVRVLRTKIFSEHWPLDEEIRETASPSHSFLANLRANIRIVYLTRFVKALSRNISAVRLAMSVTARAYE
jgi:hypothetical protein